MSERKHDAGDQHAGMVVVASLVEARADSTKVLESVDASFDYVASLVCLCIAGRRATSTRSFGQARLASILAFGADHADPTSAQRLTILPCPVGPIEPQTRRSLSRGITEPLRNVDGIEHRFHLRGVVALACGNHDREGAHLTVALGATQNQTSAAISIRRVARLSRNVSQPDHILANSIISHKADRRPGSGEIWLAVTEHDGVQVDSILIDQAKFSEALRQ